MTPAPLLQVEDLAIRFRIDGGFLRAVDGVSFALPERETLGLVGESGSGKTVSSLAILRLLETPPAEITSGGILFEGRDLLKLSEKDIGDVRGRSISMIFQEPMTSLNPVMSIGRQIDESLRRHLRVTPREARERTLELLDLVGIASPSRNVNNFPHQFSGGMRQRVMIAMALACEPKVLLADEPTTALDVTVQAQILELIASIQERIGTSILLITHDLAVIAETAHRVIVMYAGRIVEIGPVAAVFQTPRHPYTEGLLRSIPRIERERGGDLAEIPGMVPNLTKPQRGCAFAARCARVLARCWTDQPSLRELGGGHAVSCWRGADG